MEHTFKPENYSEAFDFFVRVPFYSFTDFYKKNPLAFKTEEIKYVDQFPKAYRLFYEREDYEGFALLNGNFDKEKLKNVQVNIGSQTSWQQFKLVIPLLFNRYSPTLWSELIFFTLGLLFWIFYKTGIVFPSFFRAEIYPNSYCDMSCIQNAYMRLFNFYYISSVTLVGLLLSVYLCFYKTKKIRNAQLSGATQFSAFFLLIMNLIMGGQIIRRTQQPSFQTINQIVYHPEYFKNTNSRKIASEISELKLEKTLK